MEVKTYNNYEDRELIELSINGDNIAFEYLFNKYRDSIRQLYLQKTFGNIDDTEDILQETFIKVYLNMHRYNNEYSFEPWLHTIARNTFIDHTRKSRDDISIEVANASNTDFFSGNNPEESFISIQQNRELKSLLNKISPKYRSLIELRFFKELSYEEIAEKMNIPMGTVKTQLHRAREKLCRLISDNTDILE